MNDISKNDVNKALANLEINLARVERELDLECELMNELLKENHPEYESHIRRFSNSLSGLRDSLKEVRGLAGTCAPAPVKTSNPDGATHATANATAEPSSESATPPAEEALSPKTQSSIRHDEEITLSGIIRALLMADEPLQRYNDEEKKMK